MGRLSLIELFAWAFLYYTFAVHLVPMQQELGWSAMELSSGFSLALLISGLCSPMVGRQIDLHGARCAMLSGVVLGAAGLFLWSVSRSWPVYLLSWVLIGFGMAGSLYAPAFAAAVQAYPQHGRRGILLITLVGSLASTLSFPLSAYLCAQFGWRFSLQALALVLGAGLLPLAMGLPRAEGECRPESRGQEPLKLPKSFWLFTLALMLDSLVEIAFNAYVIAFLVSQGQPLAVAAGVAGLLGVSKILGRVAVMKLERVSTLRLLQHSLSLKALILPLPLLWSSELSAGMLVLAFGAMSGARTILRPATLLESYGSRSFGEINGKVQLGTTVSEALGPLGFGVLVSEVGWSPAWLGLVLLLVLSSLCLVGSSKMSEELKG